MSELKVNKVTPRSGTTVTIGDSGEHLALAGNIGLGGATPTTSGTGITFPATASGSTNANTLDDYEEGTWTPSVASGTILGTDLVYTGTYTKIGNIVVLTFFANSSSGANNLQVTSEVQFSGLPFTVTNNGTSTVLTEDIDQTVRQGFAGVTNFYTPQSLFLGVCGSASGTVSLQVSITYITTA